MQPVLSHGEQEDPEELRRFREVWKAEVGLKPTSPALSSSSIEDSPPTVRIYCHYHTYLTVCDRAISTL